MRSCSYLKLACIFFLGLLIISCVPVKLINPNLNDTFVKVKISPEEASKNIFKEKIKSEILIDDGYLLPRSSCKTSGISYYLRIPEGKHKVSIKAEGYKAWEKTIFVSGRYGILNVDLEKE